jgi:hypothetical protein
LSGYTLFPAPLNLVINGESSGNPLPPRKYYFKGFILFITKFIGSSPNFNDASPNIEIKKIK